jgi:hypothetical protein
MVYKLFGDITKGEYKCLNWIHVMKLLSFHGVIIIIRHHSQDKYTIFLYFTNDSLITFIYWTNHKERLLLGMQNVLHIQITYIVVCFIISKHSVNKYRYVTRNRFDGFVWELSSPTGTKIDVIGHREVTITTY